MLRRRGRCLRRYALAAAALAMLGCGPREGGSPGRIHLVVEHRLAEPLATSLSQFGDDLRKEGFAVSVDDTLTAREAPERIRAALRREWQARSLDGVIMIGEFAAPLFNGSSAGDPYWHDHLVDLYYMDVDGVWTDSNDDGVLDRQDSFRGNFFWKLLSRVADRLPLGLDRRAPEFWVSRIRAGTLGELGDEIELYRDYFARNHAYRTSSASPVPPRAFIVAPGARLSTSAWGARPEKLYTDVELTECTHGSADVLRAYLSEPQGWALGVIGSFSGPDSHKFDYYDGAGFDEEWFRTREGRQRIADYSRVDHPPHDVTSREISRLRPHVYFYQLLSSETGRYDQPGYLGGAYLFFGSGLAVIAGTQHSGAIGVPMLYDELAAGRSIGDAWRNALVWSLEHSRTTLTQTWCDRNNDWTPGADVYKAVLLGDGTLHMPRPGG